MSINATYRPNEDAATIFSEHTWLQGAFLAAVAYGMEAILFSMSFYLLYTQRTPRGGAGSQNKYLLVYISIIFILSTLYMAGLLQFTQESFIDDRNIAGGPVEFENIEFSLPIDMLANVIMVLITWMCDIINVWRCLIIYRNSRVPVWMVIAVPMGMYLASIAFGMLFLKQVGMKNDSPWATSGINWTIPYYSMSLALNILVTILIVARLMVCRHRINSVMGSKHGAQYASLAAMVVESAAMYSAFALLFLIPFALGSTLAQLFLQALSPLQTVSTFLIIFRVAQGKGWSNENFKSAMTTTIGGSHATPTPIRIRAVTSTVNDMSMKSTDLSMSRHTMQHSIGSDADISTSDSYIELGRKEGKEEV